MWALYFFLGIIATVFVYNIILINSDTYIAENRQLKAKLEEKEKRIKQLETENAVLAHRIRQLENRYFQKYRV